MPIQPISAISSQPGTLYTRLLAPPLSSAAVLNPRWFRAMSSVSLDGDATARMQKRSLRMILAVSLISSINYSMVIPVAWLLVDSLGGTKRFLGWFLASYSGQ